MFICTVNQAQVSELEYSCRGIQTMFDTLTEFQLSKIDLKFKFEIQIVFCMWPALMKL